MKKFIISYAREEIICTNRVLKDAIVVVHNEEQANRYMAAGLERQNLLVSGVIPGLNGKIQQCAWIVSNLVSPGEWFVLADDDIRAVRVVEEGWYEKEYLPVEDTSFDWRKVFSNPCSVERMEKIFREMIDLSERAGVRLCGVASNENYFFRGKKYRWTGFVLGQLMLLKNEGLVFDSRFHIDDFAISADHLLRFGKVLVNNYLFADTAGWKNRKGGFGFGPEREEARRRDIGVLMREYPGLFRLKGKNDLSIKLHTLQQIERWRRDLLRKRLNIK